MLGPLTSLTGTVCSPFMKKLPPAPIHHTHSYPFLGSWKESGQQ